MLKETWYPCPCCGSYTLREQGAYEICPVCFWEDDPFQSENENDPEGANKISLSDARKNYRVFGACDAEFVRSVRAARPEEKNQVRPRRGKAFKGLPERYFK